MLETMLLLCSFLLGFMVKISFIVDRSINRIINFSISIIIVLVGYNFGSSILSILDIIKPLIMQTLLLIFFTLFLNIISLKIFFYYRSNLRIPAKPRHGTKIDFKYVIVGCAYFFYLVCGFILGLIIQKNITIIDHVINYLLIGLLFFYCGTNEKRRFYIDSSYKK